MDANVPLSGTSRSCRVLLHFLGAQCEFSQIRTGQDRVLKNTTFEILLLSMTSREFSEFGENCKPENRAHDGQNDPHSKNFLGEMDRIKILIYCVYVTIG